MLTWNFRISSCFHWWSFPSNVKKIPLHHDKHSIFLELITEPAFKLYLLYNGLIFILWSLFYSSSAVLFYFTDLFIKNIFLILNTFCCFLDITFFFPPGLTFQWTEKPESLPMFSGLLLVRIIWWKRKKSNPN